MASKLLASLKENAVFIKTPICKKMVMAVSNVALIGLPFVIILLQNIRSTEIPQVFY